LGGRAVFGRAGALGRFSEGHQALEAIFDQLGAIPFETGDSLLQFAEPSLDLSAIEALPVQLGFDLTV
jgi:hypothetical protein